jgi:DNA-binding IclR family transcriptional regulator
MTFAELTRVVAAPKSSVYGFMRGLLAKGWLVERDHRIYLGPAVYGLALVSGPIRGGLVSHDSLAALRAEVDVAVFLGARAGDHLIYIAEAGVDMVSSLAVGSDLRRTLMVTAGGKAMLAALPEPELTAYLRRRSQAEAAATETFLAEYDDIKRRGYAINIRLTGTRFAIGAAVRDRNGMPVASITLVGPTGLLAPREDELAATLLRHINAWSQGKLSPREPA